MQKTMHLSHGMTARPTPVCGNSIFKMHPAHLIGPFQLRYEVAVQLRLVIAQNTFRQT